MGADELSHAGCLNLVGAFWRQVRADLFPDRDTPESRALRTATRAWLMRRSGPNPPFPGSFEWWCAFGGLDLDPDAWREILRSGRTLPADGVLPRRHREGNS